MMIRFIYLFTSMLFFVGCATTNTKINASAEPAANDQLYALLYMQTATEYAAATQGTYAAAQQQITPLIQAQKNQTAGGGFESPIIAADVLKSWSAMPASEHLNNDDQQPLAVILDVDETVLDNSPYQARTLLQNKSFEDESWSAWSEERKARPVPGALAFLRWAANEGITPFYVTNRRVKLKSATADNLRTLGFPVNADNSNVLTRDDENGWSKDKGSRRIFVDRDYRVIALFGDNLGDFVDGVFADNTTRKKTVDPYTSWWGTRWFMLPNAMYGSWIDAITQYCASAQNQKLMPRSCMHSWIRTQ
jgi:5'-nucleotidase (lipoprotein e(P4) family)